MNSKNIILGLTLKLKDHEKLSKLIERVEDLSPSDASVFFKLEKNDNRYCGFLKIISRRVNIIISEDSVFFDHLISVMKDKWKKKNNQWKKTRNV